MDFTEIEQDVRDWVERQVGRVHPKPGFSCRNEKGEPFIAFCCGGRRIEGFPPLLLASSLSLLVEYFKAGILTYIEPFHGTAATLYWRVYPKISEFEVGGSTFYSIHTRLCIEAEAQS